MKYERTATAVDLKITGDDMTVDGKASYSGKARTIRPVSATIRYYEDSPHATIKMMGPTVKVDGSETMSHYEVTLTTDPENSVYAPAPKWLRTVVEEFRPQPRRKAEMER